MRRGRRRLLGICGLALTVSAGCASTGRVLNPHGDMETLTMSAEGHRHKIEAILELDRRALADDLDLLFMTDRSSRLSRWHSR